jgi:hypothetical protein
MTELREFLEPLVAGEMDSRAPDVVRIRPDGARIPVEIRWHGRP